MQNMNAIGNKYEITMYQWYEILAKSEKKLKDSIECNNRFGGHEDWIAEDTAKVEKTKKDIEEVKSLLKSRGINVDYAKIEKMAKGAI